MLKPLNGAFVVTEDILRKIHDHLTEAFPEGVEIEFEFANSRAIKYQELNAMLADSSVSNFALKRIVFTGGKATNGQTYAQVLMNADRGRAIYISITGSRQFVLGLEDSLTSEITYGRLPYGWLNTATWPSVNTNIALNVISLMIAVTFLVVYTWSAWLAQHVSFKLWIAVMFFSPVVGLIGPYIAPSVVFSVGRGAQDYRRRRTIISIVFGAIGLGIFVNIFSSAIS
ncbi:hypothetical protein HB770_02065 [Rhizobium leguminosarum bv. viciae]|uniref:Transmembrane protein n=1 Tax=Rhizobium leguminosarum bv. viciae TaxID=387 RepID=A0A7G6RHE3_RHILV|nr:hypothetical protein HB770_02065 [Rhizobium leguminosarum bv. viciae]